MTDLPAPSPPREDQEFNVTLPCNKEEFAEFISGLIDKPQTIGRMHSFSFRLTIENVENIFHLIKQRVESQNEAHIASFQCQVFYDNNTFATFKSLYEFSRYRELQSVRTVWLSLSLVILVKFAGYKFPAKQEVSFSFVRDDAGYYPASLPYISIVDFIRHGTEFCIKIEIKYTERSWGNDLLNLLDSEIRKTQMIDSSVPNFFYRFRSLFGLISAILIFFIVALYFRDYVLPKVFHDMAFEKVFEDMYTSAGLPTNLFILSFFEEMGGFLLRAKNSLDRIVMDSIFFPVLAGFGAAIGAWSLSDFIGKRIKKRSRIVFTETDKIYEEKDDRRAFRAFCAFLASNFLAVVVSGIFFFLGFFVGPDVTG